MTTIDPRTIGRDSVQLELLLTPLVEPVYDPNLSIDDRFAIFHAANPHVAEDLEALAAFKIDRGHKRISVKALYEVLRHEVDLRTVGEHYKLNNDFTRPYSRLLVARHPAWTEFIETRATAAERRAA